MALPRGEQLGESTRQFAEGFEPHPNSIRALRLGEHIARWDNKRKCNRCRGVAVRGYDYCRMHMGVRSVTPDTAFGRGESRFLAKLERRGLLPLELLALPCWRRLANFPTPQRAPMRLKLLWAWDARQTQPLYWTEAQRQALDMVAEAGNGKPRHTAFWYQNI